MRERLGYWQRPRGASRLHWFDESSERSACATHEKPKRKKTTSAARKCWECSMRRCPTGDHLMNECPGDHGK